MMEPDSSIHYPVAENEWYRRAICATTEGFVFRDIDTLRPSAGQSFAARLQRVIKRNVGAGIINADRIEAAASPTQFRRIIIFPSLQPVTVESTETRMGHRARGLSDEYSARNGP